MATFFLYFFFLHCVHIPVTVLLKTKNDCGYIFKMQTLAVTSTGRKKKKVRWPPANPALWQPHPYILPHYMKGTTLTALGTGCKSVCWNMDIISAGWLKALKNDIWRGQQQGVFPNNDNNKKVSGWGCRKNDSIGRVCKNDLTNETIVEQRWT